MMHLDIIDIELKCEQEIYKELNMNTQLQITTDILDKVYNLIKEKKYEEYIDLIKEDFYVRKLIRHTFDIDELFKDDLKPNPGIAQKNLGQINKLTEYLLEIADLYVKIKYPLTIVPDYKGNPVCPFYCFYKKSQYQLYSELLELIINDLPNAPAPSIAPEPETIKPSSKSDKEKMKEFKKKHQKWF